VTELNRYYGNDDDDNTSLYSDRKYQGTIIRKTHDDRQETIIKRIEGRDSIRSDVLRVNDDDAMNSYEDSGKYL